MKPVSIPNLKAFAEQLPKKRIGVLRVLWPTIQDCLTVGHSLRDIHRILHLDGIEMPYSSLCRIVAKLQHNVQPTAPHRAGEMTQGKPEPDPLRNFKRLSENRPGFDYRGTLPNEELFGSK